MANGARGCRAAPLGAQKNGRTFDILHCRPLFLCRIRTEELLRKRHRTTRIFTIFLQLLCRKLCCILFATDWGCPA